MRRELRAVLVATLVAVLVIDPATACHYCGNYWGYWEPCGGYCEPVSCCGGCEYEVVHSAPCGCDGDVDYEGPSSDSAPHEMQQPSGEPMMPHSGPTDVRRPVDRMPAPRLPADLTPPQDEPMRPSRDEPMMEEPAARSTPTADELFGPLPPAEPADDMFAPSETPAMPPEEEPPAREEETPATDDRYAPAEEPSEPSDDDMFAPSTDEPSEPMPTDDAEEPAEEPADEGFDFFDAPTGESEPATEEEPMEEEEPAAPAEQDDNDIFGGFGAILREPGGFASDELRRWVDDTGRYSCRGRLLRVLDGKVQLLKENGRTTTVTFGRLCQNDIEFIHRQASAQRDEVFGQTVQAAPLRVSN